MEGFIVLLMIAVVGCLAIVVYASTANAKKTHRAWSAAASALGIRYTPSGMFSERRMEGTLPTGPVIIETFQRGSDEHSQTHTRYRALYPAPLELKLRLTGNGFPSGLGKLFGAQDIEVGDTAFDEKIVVKGDHPAEIKRFLTPARRRHILKAFRYFPGLTLDDREVRWESPGVHSDPKQIVSTALRLSQLAWRLSAGREEDQSIEKTVESREEGLEAPAEAMPVGEGTSSAPPLPTTEPPSVPEEAQRVPEAASAPEPPLDLASVCEALFPSGSSSLEASRILEERYQGKRVDWSGVLRSVESYSFDWIFGDDPGTRAILDIYEMPSEVYGHNKVQAVLQLGAGEERTLRENVGKTVSFQGTLWRADGLMRALYLKDGNLRADGPEQPARAA